MSQEKSQSDSAVILEKIENIESTLIDIQTKLQKYQDAEKSIANIESELKLLYAQSKGQNDKSAIDGFFASKEQLVKDQVREFMLSNFNIQALDDSIEGEIYDFIVDKVWELTVGRFI